MNSRIFGIGSIAHLAVVTGILVAAPSGARAGTLATPLIYPDQSSYVVCTATNGGTTPGTVAITGHDQWGVDLKAYGQQCSDLAPGVSCSVSFDFNKDAACNFVVSGKIRAIAQVYDNSTGRTVVAVPATK